MGQAVESYNVSHSVDGKTWHPLPLRNEGMLTIGNRRIQYVTPRLVFYQFR